MPPGTPHHSFLLPYRIRVDDFASPRDVKEHFDPPALYLLSHTHSDHITGLSAKSFGARVVCSADAKHMLLNYESAGDRIAFDMGDATEKRRPYSHLKIDHKTSVNSKHKMFGRDLLRVLPLNSPTTLELSDDVTVTLTLVDANHCPGAVMFLVEGPLGNFLHTGDFRADHHFLESLARNPWLQRYIMPPVTFHDLADESGETPLRTLDAIHLDTACLLSHHALPSKEDACVGLVKLISLFPPLTRFFINSWTWGYEDILKALGRAFNSKIHVDRYKFGIYSGISDPSLRSLLTLDADATRFHACERMNRCDQVTHGIAGVVYVNPVTLSKAKWDKYFQETRASLRRGEHVSSLLCPLSRHSSLPELQAFVKLFKPKLVVPNSLNPDLANLDWACMPRMFGDCLADGGEASMRANMRGADLDIDYLDYIAPGDDVGLTEINAEMDNLVGDGAETLAKQWIDGVSGDPVHGAALGELRLVTQMGKFLGPRGKQLLTKQRTAIAWRRQKGSKEDSQRDDEAEARGKAPNLFFASSLPTTTSTPSFIDGIRNAPATPSSHPLSFHFTVHQLTPKRRATSQADSPHSVKHFSPFLVSVNSSARSKLSRMSIASLSPPAFDSSRSSDERAYHSLLDALQFNKQSSTSPYNLPFGLGQGESQSHTPAFASPLANRVLCLPCSTALTSKQKTVWRLPAMPLVSSSVTPSPPPACCHTPAQVLNSQASSFPSPRSYVMPLSGRRDQLNHVVEHPPMLDLKKIPKRRASSAGFAPPSAKRRITQPNSHTPVSSPTTVTQNIVSSCTSKEPNSHMGQKPQSTSRSAHVSSYLRTLSSNLRVMSSSHPILTVSPSPAPRSSLRLTAEKVRRSNAKATQVQIRRRLMRALPPENTPSTVKTKVERLELELAALRARKKANFIVSKQSIYGDGEAPPHSPQRSPSCQHDSPDHQDTVGGILRGQTVVFEGSTMDWEKSREYQEGFRAQRKQGIRYPPLPRLEKSFAESQSP